MRCDELDSGQRAPLMALRACLITKIFHPEDPGGQGQQAFALARQLHASGVAVSALTRRNFAAANRSEMLGCVRIAPLPPSGLLKGKGWAAVLPTLKFVSFLFLRLLLQRDVSERVCV
jgi:hypothetical protein